jgi:hypothetical protein
VCHGPTGFAKAKQPNGEPFVKGKRVTAFTNDEEDQVGLSSKVPFLLQSRLEELGANFEVGQPWAPHTVVDGLLITGQNPKVRIILIIVLISLCKDDYSVSISANKLFNPHLLLFDIAVIIWSGE